MIIFLLKNKYYYQVFDGATSAHEDDPELHGEIASFVSIQGVDHIYHKCLVIGTRRSEGILAPAMIAARYASPAAPVYQTVYRCESQAARGN